MFIMYTYVCIYKMFLPYPKNHKEDSSDFGSLPTTRIYHPK